MKTKLRLLSEATLREIARNFSIEAASKEQLVDKLAEYFKGYRISYEDVASRFRLTK